MGLKFSKVLKSSSNYLRKERKGHLTQLMGQESNDVVITNEKWINLNWRHEIGNWHSILSNSAFVLTVVFVNSSHSSTFGSLIVFWSEIRLWWVSFPRPGQDTTRPNSHHHWPLTQRPLHSTLAPACVKLASTCRPIIASFKFQLKFTYILVRQIWRTGGEKGLILKSVYKGFQALKKQKKGTALRLANGSS